jgi:hypothetical protein
LVLKYDLQAKKNQNKTMNLDTNKFNADQLNDKVQQGELPRSQKSNFEAPSEDTTFINTRAASKDKQYQKDQS